MPETQTVLGARLHLPSLTDFGFSPDVAVVLDADNNVLSASFNSHGNLFDVWEGVYFGTAGFVPWRIDSTPAETNQCPLDTRFSTAWPWTPIKDGTGPVGAWHWQPIKNGNGPLGRSIWSPIRDGKGPLGSAMEATDSTAAPAAPLLAVQILPKGKTNAKGRLKADVTLRRMDEDSAQFETIETTEIDLMIDDPMIPEGHGLADARPVADFRDLINAHPGLNLSEREVLVDQAIALLRDLYVHLPLKRAMHSIDPIQSLRLLKQRLPDLSAYAFHAELLSIFKELRDLHTNLILPTPFGSQIAFLGVLVERFFHNGAPRYIVSKVFHNLLPNTDLEEGVEITHWNGMPIDAAVAQNADKEAGSNLPSRMARGLETLTMRSLRTSLAPEEDWVDLTFIKSGSIQETRLNWLVFDDVDEITQDPPGPIGMFGDRVTPMRFNMGVDYRQETFRRVKKRMFNPQAIEVAKEAQACKGKLKEYTAAFNDRMEKGQSAKAGAKPSVEAKANITQLPTLRPDEISARRMTAADGTEYGYMRLWTFFMQDFDIEAFLLEFIRIIETEMPPEGLILDVRGNGGGFIIAAEFLLQLMTWRTITPEPAQFIATGSALEFVKSADEMEPWRQSLEQAVETGALYSKGIPISPPDLVNSIGQIYFGPIVLITDAYCYSACDMFAAGFQDHGIGTILGVDLQTGAGGANVVTHDSLIDSWPGGPFSALPGNAGMRVSLRRTMRVGEQSGDPVEDLGVKPDEIHEMTLRDLMLGNVDLLSRAMDILKAKQPRRFDLSVGTNGAGVELELTTQNIDGVDVFLNGRPMGSAAPDAASKVKFTIDQNASGLFEVLGYFEGALVAKRKVGLE